MCKHNVNIKIINKGIPPGLWRAPFLASEYYSKNCYQFTRGSLFKGLAVIKPSPAIIEINIPDKNQLV